MMARSVDSYLIDRVTERLDELEDKVAALVQSMQPVPVPAAKSVTKAQSIVLSALRRRSPNVVSTDSLLDLLESCGATRGAITAKVLQVHITKIRRQLEGDGVTINNRHNIGYYMTIEAAAAYDALCESDHDNAE